MVSTAIPTSFYTDLDKMYRACQECTISGELLEGLTRIMAIVSEIVQRNPDSFSNRKEIIFLTMAYSILASVAVGELVDPSSVESCIRVYTDGPDKTPAAPEPEMPETQYCRLRGGPRDHCVDMYRTCRNFYDVAQY